MLSPSLKGNIGSDDRKDFFCMYFAQPNGNLNFIFD